MWYEPHCISDFLRLEPIFHFSINTIHVFFYTNFFSTYSLRTYRVKIGYISFSVKRLCLNFKIILKILKKNISAGNWKFQNLLDRVRLYRRGTDADYRYSRNRAIIYLRTCAKLLPFQRSGKYVLSGSLCER